MGYYLLSIENLVVALLFVAVAVALVARIKWRWPRLVLGVLTVVLPLVFYCILIGFDLDLRYSDPATRLGWAVPLILIAVSFLIGSVIIARRGLRRAPSADVDAGGSLGDPAARRWPLGRLALAWGAAILLHATTYANLDSAARTSMAALRNEAYTMAMAIAPQPVPDYQNAATWYVQASDAVGREGLSQDLRPYFKWPKVWEQAVEAAQGDGPEFDFKSPQLAAFLAQQAGVIELYRKGAAQAECYFPHNYGEMAWDTLLPEISELRTGARLLVLHARHAAATGDRKTALADLTTVHRIARHACSEPFSVSLLVAASFDSMASKALQAIANDGPLTKDELSAFDYDPLVSYRRHLPRTLQADDAMGLNMLAGIDDRLDLSTALALADNFNRDPHRVLLLGLGPIYRVFVLVPELHAHRSRMEAMHGLVDRDYSAIKKRVAELVDRFERQANSPLAAALAPSMGYFDAVFRADATSAVERTAVALLRFRAERNEFPDVLAALSPEYITILPRDPYDEQPLRFKKTERGWVVYSVGPDLVDDGGKPFDNVTKLGDHAFVYEEPAAKDGD
jgi:hypothetical protein